jgi:hypothetical protein
VKFEYTVHTALDELRMQMLGAQVLFGFQFNGVFQDGFAAVAPAARLADTAAFVLLVATLGFLVAPAAQHRLVERGVATARLFRAANRFAELSLATYAAAIGCDVFLVAENYFGGHLALLGAMLAAVIALAIWFLLGKGVNHLIKERRQKMPERKEPELHEKIDQMLTEARVILPGAQALLGFQFVVTMMKAFKDLPPTVQDVHFGSLACVLLAVTLLISPAAVHRLGFGGLDDQRMHDLGSWLVTIALVPLAAGIAGDVFVAFSRMTEGGGVILAGAASFVLLAFLWYALPLAIRAKVERR